MNSYKELPEGYVEVKEIDAKSKKVSLIFTLASFVLTLVSIFVLYVIRYNGFNSSLIDTLRENSMESILLALVIMISIFAYIVIHELTHGICYKLLTKEKLTYGFTLSVAYCGVPNIYVNKKTALIAILAPLVVYSIIFIPLCFVLNSIWSFLFIILFGVHFGGCIGDMYGTFVLLTLKGDILMRDTGPKQTFYIKK